MSGCEFYNKDDKTCREVNGKYETDICEFDKCENSNCYYKQLKRKEQECNQLKDEKWALVSKAELETKSKEFFEERVRDLEQECERLKQTLQEIKEIATNHQFPVCEYDGFWILQGVKKRILRKISEVEND